MNVLGKSLLVQLGNRTSFRFTLFKTAIIIVWKMLPACQPLVRSNRASLFIDDVIRSTPDYQPCQICTTVAPYIAVVTVNAPFNICWCRIFSNSNCTPLLKRLNQKKHHLRNTCRTHKESGKAMFHQDLYRLSYRNPIAREKKFQSIIDTLPMEKKNVIMDMGFEGLLQLGYKELHYELITWIVANYDIGYHRLCMQTKVVVPVTPKDVREVLGISDNGVDILIYNRHGTPNRTYDIQILEDNMRDLPIGEEFKKSFLIFACATILAPNSKQKVCSPLGVAWIDDQIKRRLAAEIHTYGNYGHVQVWLYSQKNQLYIKMHLHMRPQAHIPITPPSTGDSDEAVNMERNKEEASTDVHPCSDQVMGKRTDATRTHSGQQRAPLQHGSNLVIPTPRRRYKHTPKRLVKSAAICKSPFVSQCLRLFPKISHQERLVADYALAEDGESSEILCDMHGAYITRDELCSLNGGCWVNSVVCVKSFD
ncbi:hypothetical protein CK203_056034 [Vitis vinifera]|uniref:Uncharacterized protein n=1 Tax=Vitis vinifera TaxID=29760 RepID=A0A438GS69_VITVI|nr:hypothetical protein CK203_056034 [Vitis vinifera]